MSTETTAPKKNLFAAAKKETKKPAKKEKAKVEVEGMAEKIAEYYRLTALMDNAKTRLAMLSDDLKGVGTDEYLKIYEKDQAHPGSFILSSTGTMENEETGEPVEFTEEIMFIAQDKYIKVTEDKAKILAVYEGLVDEKTTYKINDEILSRDHVGEALSDAIMGCDKLSDYEKENLLIASQVWSIKKGTINQLHKHKNIRQIFSLIEPVCQLKNCGGKDEEAE